ncbi:MAG TPA: rhomboid family intramembrane serine protease [Longimicrobiaceae bacterium]|nr:rhomboid family intramembrane serine protease [Longimicrobiaceae bacterium]
MAYSSYSNPFGGFRLTPWVKRLIIANAVVFLLTTYLLPAFGIRIAAYLALVPAAVLTRPWTLITYMFVHGGWAHIIFNMIALFFFGPVLEERWGGREFLKFYFLAGLGGALLSFVFPFQAIIGASAAIFGIMVAFALYWPESPIYIWGIFPIKAKWLVTGLIGLSVFFTLSGGQAGVAHLAHLGGAAVAYLYLKSRFAPGALGEVYGSHARKKKRRSLRSFFTRSEKKPTRTIPVRRETAREVHRRLDEVDRILDKISEGGMASLTPEERRRLEEASRNIRSN